MLVPVAFGNFRSNFKLQTGKQFGSIERDPRLIAYRADGRGDYHLSSESPAIRAGTAEGAPWSDFDGMSRLKNHGYDIGPFQFVDTMRSQLDGARQSKR